MRPVVVQTFAFQASRRRRYPQPHPPAAAPTTPFARRNSVKDAQSGPVQGRVRWRRFAAVLLPATVATAALMGGIANGAVPTQFSVSGQTFKVSAAELEGENFTQYGGVTTGAKHQPVAVSYIGHARLKNLCQSVAVPDAPFPLGLVIKAGWSDDKTRQVDATDLLIEMDELSGDATFGDINIGRDASELAGTKGRQEPVKPGSFGQEAKKVFIKDLRQTARSTAAGTFTLRGLNLSMKVGNFEECFK
jgi:hypothetical protein